MMEDDDHWEWYDFSDVNVDADLSDVPQQSVSHGTPVMPVEECNPI